MVLKPQGTVLSGSKKGCKKMSTFLSAKGHLARVLRDKEGFLGIGGKRIGTDDDLAIVVYVESEASKAARYLKLRYSMQCYGYPVRLRTGAPFVWEL